MADELNNKYIDPETGDAGKSRWQTILPEQWELIDLIGCLCGRPKMFLPGGSISEGVAYINGFASGRGGSVMNELNKFCDWLAARAYKRDGTARNLVWVSYIEQLYSDDERAFAELPALFDLFLSEQNANDVQ